MTKRDDDRIQIRRAESRQQISESYVGMPIEFDDLSTASAPRGLSEDHQDDRSRDIVLSEAASLISNPDDASIRTGVNERETSSDISGQSTASDRSNEVGGWMAAQDQLKRSATWGPFWLQPIVFATFAGIFTCITIGLILLEWYSLHNDGLFTPKPGFSYVWRFGLTAALTLLSALWSRVEMQARIYMPWLVLCRGRPSDEVDFELDYTSMAPPILLAQAWKRKHYLVLVSTIAGILLKIQIVLAPSLFETAVVEFGSKVAIQLLDVFDPKGNNDAPPGFLIDTSPYYVAQAQEFYGISQPFGVSTGLAYQRFEPRGTRGATIVVTVDALFVEMKCLKMVSHTIIGQDHANKSAHYSFHTSVRFEGCGPFILGPFEMPVKHVDRFWLNNLTFTPINPCPNLPQQNYQFIYFGGDYETTNTTTGSHLTWVGANAVICSAQTWISKFKVVDNGVTPKVETIPSSKRHPFKVDIWALIKDTVPNQEGHLDWSKYAPNSWPEAGPVRVLTSLRTGEMWTIFDSGVFNGTVMFDSVLALTDLLGPLVASYGLRQNRIIEAEGDLFVRVARLKTNLSVCLVMLLISILLLLVALSQIRCRSTIWHRNPTTVLGNMIFFHEHPNIRRQALSGRRQGKRLSWGDCSFSPYVLKKRVRLAFTIATCFVIVALNITLDVSEKHEGLASTRGLWSLLWTSFPTFVVLGVSLYVSSCDSSWRALLSLHSVFSEARSANHLDISLQDMLGFRVLMSSIKLGAWPILMSQIVTLACAVLTTIASVLFTVKFIPNRTDLQLRQASWFGDRLHSDEVYKRNRRAIADLMFRKEERHVVYPKDTYDDFVLPLLSGIPVLSLESTSNITIEATLPAATMSSSCEKIPGPEFAIPKVILFSESQPTMTVPVTCPNGTSFNYVTEFLHGGGRPDTSDNKTYFGSLTGELRIKYADDPCQLPRDIKAKEAWITYFWGVWDSAANRSDFTAVWKCKYAWAEVMVSVKLVSDNGEVQIDQTTPPVPISSTLRPYDPPFSLPIVSSIYQDIRLRHVLGDQRRFAESYWPLFRPHGEFALEAFGKPDQELHILEALNYRRKFVSAQLANLESRHFVGAFSQSSQPPSGDLPLVSATLTENDTKRLVQSAIATYILTSLLGIVVLHNIFILSITVLRQRMKPKLVKFVIMETEGLAPERFGSIASSASLLQETNISKNMAATAHDVRLEGLQLRMGWFQREPEKSRHYTIGVMKDEEFVFLGSKRKSKEVTGAGKKTLATLGSLQ